jgi:hypothetical protein
MRLIIYRLVIQCARTSTPSIEPSKVPFTAQQTYCNRISHPCVCAHADADHTRAPLGGDLDRSVSIQTNQRSL